MAAPGTHIVLTKKIFTKYFSDKIEADFYVGTSFPDIRYLGIINRDKTHFKGIQIEDIKQDESFISGLKFHSIVDEIREQYFHNNGYYKLFPKSDYVTQAMKILEDRVLYHKINDWNEILTFFDKIYKQEKNFGINTSDIKRWHLTLTTYLSHDPKHNHDIYNFINNINRPREIADEIIIILNNIDNSKAKKIILDFYDDFENLLS